jgi:hypothetical protein
MLVDRDFDVIVPKNAVRIVDSEFLPLFKDYLTAVGIGDPSSYDHYQIRILIRPRKGTSREENLSFFEIFKPRSRLRVTATAHEPLAEILPGDALDRSRLQLRCTAFELGQPDAFCLSICLLEAVEQPRRHFGAVVLVQLQGLANDVFYDGLHAESLAHRIGRLSGLLSRRRPPASGCAAVSGSTRASASRRLEAPPWRTCSQEPSSHGTWLCRRIQRAMWMHRRIRVLPKEIPRTRRLHRTAAPHREAQRRSAPKDGAAIRP